MRIKRLGSQAPRLTLTKLALLALVGTLLLAGASYAVNSMAGQAGPIPGLENVVNLTSKSQDIWGYIGSREKVVLFWETEFCPGCKILRPHLLSLAREMPDVLFVRVHIDKLLSEDADYALSLADEFGVYGTPTIIVYVNGRETGRHLGLFTEAYVSPRDQGYYLEKFIRDSIEERFGGSGLLQLMGTGVIAPVAFGLIGALAPCSLPMIASFALVSGRGSQRRFLERVAVNTITLVSATMTLGFVLALAYLASTVLGLQLIYAG
ncbi:MAG: thioredoxin family protein, partial [Desulfurococcales archaeon]|nr:thioredoxin family protein [Desulfurococcales archaeon]